MNSVNDMTISEFKALPSRKWNEDIGEFDSLIILPTARKHDSGYRCMDFIACRGNEAICRLSGGSDVIHINGIGGYGYRWFDEYKTVPHSIAPIGWSIDCLPKSGLLRLFCGDKLRAGQALSSFEIFAIQKRR